MCRVNTVSVRVKGPFACFTRPEAKVERVSYQCMTPAAARGVLEAILWKPQFSWLVHAIHVLQPIAFFSIRRNEIEKVIPVIGGQGVLSWMTDPSRYRPFYADLQSFSAAGSKKVIGNRVQRSTLVLKDVEYVIIAEPVLTEKADKPRKKAPDEDELQGPDTVQKYVQMFRRRVEKGQCFQHPYLGLREFVAAFEPVDDPPLSKITEESMPLGRMFYDYSYRKARNPLPLFAQAVLQKGVLDVDQMRAEVLSQEQH